eukprot:5291729-Amphidinium_carterae.1
MSQEPALDTGASHSLHPIELLDSTVPESDLKKIYLNVAASLSKDCICQGGIENLMTPKLIIGSEVSYCVAEGKAATSSLLMKAFIETFGNATHEPWNKRRWEAESGKSGFSR